DSMSNVLLVAEAFGGQLRKATFNAVTFAKQAQQAVGGELHILVLGQRIEGLAKQLTAYGANQVWFADSDKLAHPIASAYAQVIAQAAKQVNAEIVCAAATASGKDIFPRVAARIPNAALAADVLKMENPKTYRRAMWAGNIVATIEIETAVKVVTLR